MSATTTPATPTPDATTPGRVELPWETVREIADDRHVLSVYAAPEFEELSDDGRAWIKAVVEVAFLAGSAALAPSPAAGMGEIESLICKALAMSEKIGMGESYRGQRAAVRAERDAVVKDILTTASLRAERVHMRNDALEEAARVARRVANKPFETLEVERTAQKIDREILALRTLITEPRNV